MTDSRTRAPFRVKSARLAGALALPAAAVVFVAALGSTQPAVANPAGADVVTGPSPQFTPAEDRPTRRFLKQPLRLSPDDVAARTPALRPLQEKRS